MWYPAHAPSVRHRTYKRLKVRLYPNLAMTPWRAMDHVMQMGVVVSMRMVVASFVCFPLTTYLFHRWGTVQCRQQRCCTVRPITKPDTT